MEADHRVGAVLVRKEFAPARDAGDRRQVDDVAALTVLKAPDRVVAFEFAEDEAVGRAVVRAGGDRVVETVVEAVSRNAGKQRVRRSARDRLQTLPRPDTIGGGKEWGTRG